MHVRDLQVLSVLFLTNLKVRVTCFNLPPFHGLLTNDSLALYDAHGAKCIGRKVLRERSA